MMMGRVGKQRDLGVDELENQDRTYGGEGGSCLWHDINKSFYNSRGPARIRKRLCESWSRSEVSLVFRYLLASLATSASEVQLRL